jgi:hypothetical protein
MQWTGLAPIVQLVCKSRRVPPPDFELRAGAATISWARIHVLLKLLLSLTKLWSMVMQNVYVMLGQTLNHSVEITDVFSQLAFSVKIRPSISAASNVSQTAVSIIRVNMFEYMPNTHTRRPKFYTLYRILYIQCIQFCTVSLTRKQMLAVTLVGHTDVNTYAQINTRTSPIKLGSTSKS